VTNRLDRNFELAFDKDIDIDYVDSAGNLISDKSRLATCFQIWKKTAKPRIPVRIRDMGVVEKVGPENADVSLTIFGYGCGQLKTEFDPVPNTTKLFLKLKHPKALEALKTVDFSKFYTLKIKGTTFLDCSIIAVDFMNTDLTEVLFDNCDLYRTEFAKANLNKANLKTSYNYTIDPTKTKIKKATFALENLKGLLFKHDIIVSGDN
jgi:hypothetical protein